MILQVRLQMVGEVVDSVGEYADLHVRAAGILIVQSQSLKCFVCHCGCVTKCYLDFEGADYAKNAVL